MRMINWKGYEKRWSWPTMKQYVCISPEEQTTFTKELRVAELRAEILNRDFLDKKLI
jgi:hypothetical protein